MDDIAEKRVYEGRAGAESVYVATAAGVAVVSVSGGRIGEFGLQRRCVARDVAAGDGWVAVATDEDVLVRPLDGRGASNAGDGPAGREGSDGGADDGGSDGGGDAGRRPENGRPAAGAYVETGFGSASAVGADDGALVAASDPDSEIGRLIDPAADPTDWLLVADVDAPVRAIDGPLLAAGDGVYRLTPDAIADVGLTDVRDVSAPGAPLAATGDGLYRLGNGWLRDRPGPFDVVAADPADARPGDPGLAYAVGDAVHEHVRGEGWVERDLPATPADVAFGETTYAVAADGTFLADCDDRWETGTLGLDAAGLAVPR